jgi:hypothetical protein
VSIASWPKAARPSPVTPAQGSPATLPRGRHESNHRRRAGAQFRDSAGGPGHHRSQPDPAGRRPAAFTVITTPSPSSAEPSDCSASPAVPGTRRHLKITEHFRRQMLYRAPMQGNFGLGSTWAMSSGMSIFPLADLARRQAV